MVRIQVPVIFGDENRITDNQGGVTQRVHDRLRRPFTVGIQTRAAHLILGYGCDKLGLRHANGVSLREAPILHFTFRDVPRLGIF